MTTLHQLEIVSDVVCPWCYVGKRRLELALGLLRDDYDFNIAWRAFELNPWIPAEGIARDHYCVQKFGSLEHAQQLYANVATQAEDDGLAMDHLAITRMPNTRDAHRLIWFATDADQQDIIVDALFKAYFVDGRDIGARQTLIDIAQDCNMPASTVAEFLASEAGVTEIIAEEQRAHELGINGVPAFLIDGRYLFSGAQTAATISLAIRKAADKLSSGMI